MNIISLFSFSILLLINTLIKCAKNPSIDFIPNFRSQIIIDITIGAQDFKVLLDTSSVFLWLFNVNNTSPAASNKHTFNPSKSPTFTPVKYSMNPSYIKGNLTGTFGKDDLVIGKDITISNFSFFLVETSNNIADEISDVDGVLGIGFNYEDHPDLIQFSLLEQMSNKNMIDSKMFNIKFKNEYKGTISFGDLITEEITDLYNGTCQPYKIEEGTEIAKWKCKPTRIELGNLDKNISEAYNEPAQLVFDTSIDYLLVPSDFFIYKIKRYLLKNEIELNICKEGTISKNEVTYITIKCNQLLEFGLIYNIYFVFDSYAMMYSPIDMFYQTEEEGQKIYTLKILSIYGNSRWIIGQPVLKNFYMVFDKSNEIIQFSSRDYLINLNQKTYQVLFFVFIVGCITVLLLIGGYSLFSFLNKKYDFDIEDKNYRPPSDGGEDKPHYDLSLSISKDSLVPKVDFEESVSEEFELKQ